MDTVPDGRGQDDNPGNVQPRPDTHPLNSLYKHSRERTRPLFRTLVMITSDNHVTMGTTAIARGGAKGHGHGLLTTPMPIHIHA